MTNEQIKKLEAHLWEAADDLRANSKLTAAEYKDPVLGLILLRFAQNRFEEVKKELEKTLPINPRTGKPRELTKEDFIGAGALYLQEKSKYDYLAALPEGEDLSEAINEAMRLIEADYPDLEGILPKNYQDFDPDLLRGLVRVFNSEAVQSIEGDAFGRIYEYFLMKFSMSGAGAQEGGEFFTPPSLVQLIVNFIEPDHGIVHDPACGSGGMFVQTGYFIENRGDKPVNEAVRVYGTELKTNNVKLAKMNLAIHGIEGKIIEDNSFYADPHHLVGKCDFVMANPPFNVKKVDKSRDFVKNDPRLPFGLPRNDNANYLWIQYFYSYLNDTGRAGFVMASSATDAGNTEKAIRQKIIETGSVEAIVSIGNNFFYTRSLPCHLWFLNKAKRDEESVLMIDARKIYRVVSTTINDFSEGQLLNLTTIMRLYRGEEDAVTRAEGAHHQALSDHFEALAEHYDTLRDEIRELDSDRPLLDDAIAWELFETLEEAQTILERFENPAPLLAERIDALQSEIETIEKRIENKEIDKKTAAAQTKPLKERLNKLKKPLKKYHDTAAEYLKEASQRVDDWKKLKEWFPEGVYRDVEGLCKIVDRAEIEENDFSLTPGRYVGYTIEIDEDFDYKGRMREIHAELERLNGKAEGLMKQILSLEW